MCGRGGRESSKGREGREEGELEQKVGEQEEAGMSLKEVEDEVEEEAWRKRGYRRRAERKSEEQKEKFRGME